MIQSTLTEAKQSTHNWALICSNCGTIDTYVGSRMKIPYSHQCTQCGVEGQTRWVQSLHYLLMRTHERRVYFRCHYSYVISQCHRTFKEYELLRKNQTEVKKE